MSDKGYDKNIVIMPVITTCIVVRLNNDMIVVNYKTIQSTKFILVDMIWRCGSIFGKVNFNTQNFQIFFFQQNERSER